MNDEDLLQFANNLGFSASRNESTSGIDKGSGTFNYIQPPNHYQSSITSPFQIPKDVFTTPHRSKLNAAYNLSKNYRLFIAPDDSQELDTYCFYGIGDSANFCINRNYKIKHNGEKFLVAPGEAFIRNSTKIAFMEPAVNSNFWDEDLKNQWMQDSCTFNEWVDRFGLIRKRVNNDLSKPITSSMIEEEFQVKKTALALQSTRKRKILPKSEPQPVSYSLGIYLSDPGVKSPSIDTLTTCIIEIDAALRNVIGHLNLVQKEIISHEIQNRMALLQGEEKIDQVENILGVKPQTIPRDFDAPSIWATLGILSSRTNHLLENLDQHVKKRAKKVAIEEISTVHQDISNLNTRQDLNKRTLVAISNAIQNLNKHVAEIQNPPTPAKSNVPTLVPTINGNNSLPITRIEKIEEEIRAMKLLTDNDTIRFGALGFKSYSDACSLLLKKCPHDIFGFMSDVHVILEILNVEMGCSVSTNPNVDSIKHRADLVKLKLSTDWERYTVTSFDRSIPRRFLSNAKFAIVKSDSSYFDTVTFWYDWKGSEMGFRIRITSALKIHKETMEDYLRNTLSETHPLFRITYESLLASISWIEELLRYIDSTYEEYVESKFNSKKAWNITTRLAKALLLDIVRPRQGVAQAVQSQNVRQMMEITFYGILKSLDRMEAIQKQGFKNSPIVSSELIKVLSKNTAVEAIENLNCTITNLTRDKVRLQNEITDLKTQNKALSSLANSANNKVDQQKTNLEALKKIVSKLEAKVVWPSFKVDPKTTQKIRSFQLSHLRLILQMYLWM